jgi:hypothetical protein
MEYTKTDIHTYNPSRAAAALDDALGGAVEATQDMRQSKAAEIEKRGFSYNGDTNSNWGLYGANRGFTGFGGAGFSGRGVDTLGNFSIQPFGIGGSNSNLSPTIFSNSGANTGYSQSTHVAHMKMAMAVEAYKGFGVVKNVIDLMCNFASEGLSINHPRPAIKKFYQRWAQCVDLQGRVKDILRYYYKHGNCFVYTTMGVIDAAAYNKMRLNKGVMLSTADTNDPSEDERQEEVEKERTKPAKARKIPWRYTLLNPFQMELRGSKYFGESNWVFILDEKTQAAIRDKTARSVDFLDETDVNLPSEFKKLKTDKHDSRAMPLDQSKLWTFHYMKDDHEDWADPMVWPVMNDIMYKQALRAMDISVVNSTINATTIYKLGDLKNGFIAPKSHFKQFSEMLRTPSYSHNIVWNDAITMESNYPPIEKILSIDKYRSVDRDILAGLGIPSILVEGTEGGNFSNAFLQVRTLLERLEEGRTEVIKWINKQLTLIADTMGHRDIPTIKFGQMSLKDEQAEKNLIIQLLDRNIISAEAVHEIFGMDTVTELERMRLEKKIADEEDVMVKHGPYTDPMNDLKEDEKIEKQFKQQTKLAEQKAAEIKKNGRPPGTKGIPQAKKRVTKPKGMGLGSIIEHEKLKSVAANIYSEVDKILTGAVLAKRGLKYKKELQAEDRDALDSLVLMAFSNCGVEFSPDGVMEMLAAPEPNENFLSILSHLGEAGTAAEIREKRILAFTILHGAEDE